MRLTVFEVESRLAVPHNLAMSPGKIIIDYNRISPEETAASIGPGSPEVATVVKFLDICGITTSDVIRVRIK
jgi:hypothetical protein